MASPAIIAIYTCIDIYIYIYIYGFYSGVLIFGRKFEFVFCIYSPSFKHCLVNKRLQK